MAKIQAVLHDWDDTITGSFETYQGFYFELSSIYNLQVPTTETIRKHWGKTVPEIIQGVWPELTEEDVRRIFSEFKPQAPYIPTPFPNVWEVFKSLHENKIKLGIVSSGIRAKIIETYTTHFGNNIIHEYLYFENETGFHKPDPRVFNNVLGDLAAQSIPKENVVYVGDHLYDFYAARDAGITFYAVTTGVCTKEDFLIAGLADKFIFRHFSEILSVIS